MIGWICCFYNHFTLLQSREIIVWFLLLGSKSRKCLVCLMRWYSYKWKLVFSSSPWPCHLGNIYLFSAKSGKIFLNMSFMILQKTTIKHKLCFVVSDLNTKYIGRYSLYSIRDKQWNGHIQSSTSLQLKDYLYKYIWCIIKIIGQQNALNKYRGNRMKEMGTRRSIEENEKKNMNIISTSSITNLTF